jgi:hypothetical protein
VRIGRVNGNDCADRAKPRQRLAHGIRGRAEVDRNVELAQHRAEPIRQIIGGAIKQEGRRAQIAGSSPTLADQGAIENEWALRHRSYSV